LKWVVGTRLAEWIANGMVMGGMTYTGWKLADKGVVAGMHAMPDMVLARRCL
jgi:hypothetical protein